MQIFSPYVPPNITAVYEVLELVVVVMLVRWEVVVAVVVVVVVVVVSISHRCKAGCTGPEELPGLYSVAVHDLKIYSVLSISTGSKHLFCISTLSKHMFCTQYQDRIRVSKLFFCEISISHLKRGFETKNIW